jgi:DNA primase
LPQTRQEIAQLGYEVGLKEKSFDLEETDKESTIFSLVTKIYQHNLFSGAGKKAFAYLQQKRQLNYAAIEQFELGHAINHQQLTNLFLPDTEKIKQLISTNLLRTNKGNQIHDFFSEDQLIFPLQNEKGKIVAFAARQVEDSKWLGSKYVYLPNYEKYQKSQIIYNYFTVKQMSEIGFCYLVEGFFDMISLNQAGITNCLASLGTSLSKSQISLLKGLKKKIILFLDGDSAGEQAVIKIVISLLAQDVECEVINHSLSLDPDEICRQKRIELNQILQQKEDPYIFVLRHFIQE